MLLHHHDAPIHGEGVAGWLASWADLVGVVRITEPGSLIRKRLRRELARVGLLRLIDVIAFRLYYRLTAAGRDRAWLDGRLADLRARYPLPGSVPIIDVASPNSAEAQAFLTECRPTLVIALCKNILAERIFSIPRHGTMVFHPGICPEYRNAHGCFWALASDDLARVGLSVLRIDRGIDTGPVLGYFSAEFDEVAESHIIIQHRMLLDNLDGIAALLRRVQAGQAAPIDTAGRPSHEWGQPWLTRYLRWKQQARQRRAAHDHA
ncbi:MAG: formyltransferase family protein [Gemmatimonadales bacterium]